MPQPVRSRIRRIRHRTRHLAINTHGEIAASTFLAYEIMATMPAYANAIAFFLGADSHSKSINAAGNFMTRHTRILQTRPERFFYQHIAVADPQASTFTRTFPGPGSGISRSTNSKSPPALLIWAAFIFVFTRTWVRHPFLSRVSRKEIDSMTSFVVTMALA